MAKVDLDNKNLANVQGGSKKPFSLDRFKNEQRVASSLDTLQSIQAGEGSIKALNSSDGSVLGDTLGKKAVDSSITQLMGMSTGQDQVMDRTVSKTMKSLGAQQGAEQQSLANIAAQRGLSGQQAVLQSALLGRSQDTAQADTRSQLAIAGLERQRQATKDLGALGIQATQADLQEKQLELADVAQRVSAARAVIDAIETDYNFLIDEAVTAGDLAMNDERVKQVKMVSFENKLSKMDPSDNNFAENVENAFLSTYGYSSIEDLEAKAVAGDQNAVSVLNEWKSLDYDTIATDTYNTKANEGRSNLLTSLGYLPMDEFVTSEGYDVFDDNGVINPALSSSAAKYYWNTKEGMGVQIIDENGNTVYTDDFNEFQKAVNEGRVSEEFKKFINNSIERHYTPETSIAYQSNMAELYRRMQLDPDDPEYLSKEDAFEIGNILKVQADVDMTSGENISTFVDASGNEVTVLKDNVGNVIYSSGYDVDPETGQIKGMVNVNGRDVVLKEGEGINTNLFVDAQGNFDKGAVEELFELTDTGLAEDPNGNIMNEISYDFYKRDDGTMGVNLIHTVNGNVMDSENDWVKVKDITKLPGYEQAKSNLKGSDPTGDARYGGANLKDVTGLQGEGLKESEKGSIVSDKLGTYENLGDEFDYYTEGVADPKATIGQIKAGNAGVINDVKTSLEDGNIVDELVFRHLMEEDPEYIDSITTVFSPDDKISPKNNHMSTGLDVKKGDLFEYDGRLYRVESDMWKKSWNGFPYTTDAVWVYDIESGEKMKMHPNKQGEISFYEKSSQDWWS